MQDGYFSVNGICFDIGNTVLSALQYFARKGEPYAGSKDPYSAGNGSIMRLTPVPMAYGYDIVEAIDYAAKSSSTTHGATEAVDACRYFAAMLVGAFNGLSKDELLASYSADSGFWRKHDIVLSTKVATISNGAFIGLEPPRIAGTGYVVDSLEAALWAFYKTDNFRDGALLAVNLGDDADTTGAVYGQIAGAYYGSIPEDWNQTIAERPVIELMARKLFQLRKKLGNEI